MGRFSQASVPKQRCFVCRQEYSVRWIRRHTCDPERAEAKLQKLGQWQGVASFCEACLFGPWLHCSNTFTTQTTCTQQIAGTHLTVRHRCEWVRLRSGSNMHQLLLSKHHVHGLLTPPSKAADTCWHIFKLAESTACLSHQVFINGGLAMQVLRCTWKSGCTR